MRHFIALLFLSGLFSVSVHAQTVVPNGSFEEWKSDTIAELGNRIVFHPVTWGESINPDPEGPPPVFRSTDAHSGTYALGGIVLNGSPSPFVSTSYGPDDGGSISYHFPITGRPRAFELWYKFKSVGNDYLYILPHFNGYAVAIFEDSTTKSDYTHLVLPFPDRGDSGSAFIDINVYNTQGILHSGTEYVIDDVAFSSFASVTVPEGLSFGLRQNYPNPFSASTVISYSLSENTHVTLEVFNMLGERIALLDNSEEMAGTHQALFNGAAYPSGTYLCRLATPQSVSTRFIQLSH